MAWLEAKGRGKHYSPLRGMVEISLGIAYKGGWAGRLWGRMPGATDVAVLRTRLEIPGLRAPLRLAFASDLHVGPTTPVQVLKRAFAEIAAAKPDILALGGDYVFLDPDAEHLATLTALVASVPAALKVGVWGNHDLWTWHDRVEAALVAGGVRMLVNDAARLPDAHENVAIVGIDEPWTGAPDPDAAFAAAGDADVLLALGHSPDALPFFRGRGASILTVGHTHGGQIALPGPRPLIVPGPLGKTYPFGEHAHEDLRLFVSRGLGGVELPMRYNAPPDVLILDLVGPT